MVFFGLLVAFMERTCLSMAITQMVNTPNIDADRHTNEAVCPAPNAININSTDELNQNVSH